MRRLAALVSFIVVLAGCVGGEGADGSLEQSGAPLAPEAQVDDTTGAIRGVVTDDSLTPLAGATVGIPPLELTTTTDEAGQFVLNGVPGGTHPVAAAMLGYSSGAQNVDVVVGEITETSFRLVAMAIEEAYYISQEAAGRFGCGFAIRPVTALAACAATYGTPLEGTDKFRVDFHLTAENVSKVKSLIMESQWRSTQAMSGGFVMYWETYQIWGAGTTYTEKVRSISSARGNSPIKAATDDEEMQEKFKAWHKPGETPPKYCVKDGKCSIYARAFPYAGTLGSGYPADVSVYIDQPFKHWVTEFFGDYATEDFTALGDA